MSGRGKVKRRSKSREDKCIHVNCVGKTDLQIVAQIESHDQGVLQVTPRIAKAILNVSEGKNLRPYTPRLARKYADDMERKQFSFTGEPLQFCGGYCGNGQHRCGAIILSKSTLMLSFISGIEPAALHHVDVGKKRTYANMLAGRDIPGSRYVAAVVNTCWQYRKNPDLIKTLVPGNFDDLDRIFKKCPEEFIRAAKEGAKLQGLIPVSASGLFYFLVHRKRPDELVRFWDALKNGANLGPRSPILYLRKELQERRIVTASRGGRTSKSEYFALLTCTWNNIQKKINAKPVWRPRSKPNEKMPTILFM